MRNDTAISALQDHTLNTGRLGEQVVAEYLRQRGYTLMAQNFRKQYAEIDLIATKPTKRIGNRDVAHETVHFIEVKTVSHGTLKELECAVTRETWRPEELVHEHKLNQIRKGVETWVLEHGWEGELQIDVAAVRIVPCEKFATVNLIENIVIE